MRTPEQREQRRKWAAENKGKVAAQRKRHWEKNKERISAQRKTKYRENKEVFADRLLGYMYGMSLAEYEEMLESQGHNCALCGESLGEPIKGKSRHPIDHDHNGGNSPRCGREGVRGILHHKCNTLLGYVEKNPDLVEKVKAYISRRL
jgi:Recombination endonuclease VII